MPATTGAAFLFYEELSYLNNFNSNNIIIGGISCNYLKLKNIVTRAKQIVVY